MTFYNAYLSTFKDHLNYFNYYLKIFAHQIMLSLFNQIKITQLNIKILFLKLKLPFNLT